MISVTAASRYLKDDDTVDPMTATLVIPDKQVGAVMVVGTVTTRLNRLVRAVEQVERDRKKVARSEEAKRRHHERRTKAATARREAVQDRPHPSTRRRAAFSATRSTGGLKSGGGGGGGLLTSLAGGALGGVAGRSALTRALPMLGRVAGKIAAPLALLTGGYGVYSSVKDGGKADVLDAITAGAGAGGITGAIFGGVGAVPGAIIGGLLGGAGAIIYNSREAIASTYGQAKQYLGDLSDAATAYAKDKWSSATKKMGEVSDYAKEKIGEAWDSVKKTAAEYRDQVGEWLSNQGKTLREWFDGVTAGLRSAISLQSLRAMASEWLSALKNWFYNKFKTGGGGSGGSGGEAGPGVTTSAGGSGSANSANPFTRGQSLPNQDGIFSAEQPRTNISPIAGSNKFINPIDPANSPGSGLDNFSAAGIAATTPRVNEIMRQEAGNFRPVSPGGMVPSMVQQGASLGLPRAPAMGSSVTPLGGQDAASRAASSMATLAGLKVNDYEGRAKIAEYLRTGGHGMDPATTSWCAATVGSALRQAGIQDIPQSKGGDVATSYSAWGRGVDISKEKVQAGDVMVLTRGLPTGALGGHVGMATGKVDAQGRIQMIQGNTGNWENGVRRGSKSDYSWERPRSDLLIRRATPDMIKAPAISNPEPSPEDSNKTWRDFKPSLGLGSNGGVPRASQATTADNPVEPSSVKEKEPAEVPSEREDTPDASVPASSSGIKGKRVSIDDIPTVHPNVHLAMVGASDKA